MKIGLFLLVFTPALIKSQNSYNTDDQFSLNNPSSFSDQKIHSTGLLNFGSLENLNYLSAFMLYKQKIKAFSIGLNSEITRFHSFFLSKSEIQLAYSYRINRNYTLNSGLGLAGRTDNYFSADQFNPAYFGLNAGISLVSKKGYVGLSLLNVTSEKRIIDTLTFHVPTYASIVGSYDFKLDSLGKFHLIPSFYMEIGSSGFNSSLYNLKLNFLSHSFGLTYTSYQPSIFYQYLFKKGISLGIALGTYFSPLNNSFDKSFNGMVRINYRLKRRVFICSGTPSF